MPDKRNDLDKNRLISLADAANIYGFSQNYLRQLIHRDRLQAEKVGGVWLTTRASIEEYIEGRQKRGVYREDIDPSDN